MRRASIAACALALAACARAPDGAARVGAGLNLALNRPATGSPVCKPGEEAGKAFNGRNRSWTHDKFCTLAKPAWLQVDLGGVHTVHRFTVRHAGAAGEPTGMNTRAFRISTSFDARAWDTAVEVQGNTDSVTVHDIAPRRARHVRMDVTEPTQAPQDPATRIYELEVR